MLSWATEPHSGVISTHDHFGPSQQGGMGPNPSLGTPGPLQQGAKQNSLLSSCCSSRGWGGRGVCWTEGSRGSGDLSRDKSAHGRSQILEGRSESPWGKPPALLALCCPGAGGWAVTHRKVAGHVPAGLLPPGVPEPERHVSYDRHCRRIPGFVRPWNAASQARGFAKSTQQGGFPL